MVQRHCSTVGQRVEWVSELVAHSGTYGLVSDSAAASVSRARCSTSGRPKGKRTGTGVDSGQRPERGRVDQAWSE